MPTDSVMGLWSYSYDTLNRVQNGSATSGVCSSLGLTWSYDAFGNRTAQTVSGSPSQPAPQAWSATI
jgi:hypothetical protein